MRSTGKAVLGLALLVCIVSCGEPLRERDAQPKKLPRLGPSIGESTVTFRVPSRRATRMEIWFYADPFGDVRLVVNMTREKPDRFVAKVPLSDLRAAGIETIHYGLRVWGPNFEYDPTWLPGSLAGFESDVDAQGNRFNPNKLLLDPYAHEISHDPGTDWLAYATGEWRSVDSGPVAPKGIVVPEVSAPRGGPGRAPEDEVIYEVHVRGLTMLDPEVPEELRGTYAGAALRAAKLADLGVTAIELLPVHESPNDQNDLEEGTAGDNYWGYTTLGFFAPDRRYAADKSPGGPTREFRDMVDAFHAAGLSVVLDVVYNHTAEGGNWNEVGDTAALLSWRGIDNTAFYQTSGPSHYRSDNGVGPNLNASDPIARQMVLDSLAYWKEELGVDGFRFDLAPILGNACSDGCFAYEPNDPEGIFMRAANEIGGLLIAEPWGATGEAYRVGSFPSGFAEWNDAFRDTVRADQNRLGVVDVTLQSLVEVMVGSPGRFADDGRMPWSSVAFVVAHDGFTLADLYGCNESNNNQAWPYGPSDGGSSHNLSWDHGGDAAASERAARTGMALTLLAAGIPMFNGGDELLRSQRCNNNAYNLDSPGNWIDWSTLESEHGDFHAFTRRLLHFRAAHVALRPAAYRQTDELLLFEPSGGIASSEYLESSNWHALAFYLDGDKLGDTARAILLLYNGWQDAVTFSLPAAPSGEAWGLVTDTAGWLAEQDHGFPLGEAGPLPDDTYEVAGRSLAVLIDE